MSLTSHLRNRASPVRLFFEQNFPRTMTVARDANRALREGRVQPPVLGHGNAGLVGTAADVLLNAWIDPTVEPARPAASPTLDGTRILFESQQAVMQHLTDRPDPSLQEWQTLVRHGLLMAMFVSVGRSMQAHTFVSDALVGAAPELDAYAQRLWCTEDEEDLLALILAGVEDHADLRGGQAVAVNPTFALSASLGGADADLIVDGTLWDYKATRQSRIVGRLELWQLVGYLLADSDNHYVLHSIGVTALRWRARLSWPASELLGQLNDTQEDYSDLEPWRKRFSMLLADRPRRRIRLRRADRKQ